MNIKKLIFIIIIIIRTLSIYCEDLKFELFGNLYQFNIETQKMIIIHNIQKNNPHSFKNKFKNYQLLIEKNFIKDKGFKIIVKDVNKNKVIFFTFIKLFISDMLLINNNILITGTTINNNKNVCMLINTKNKKKKIFFVTPKHSNFLKFISTPNKIFIYNSSKPKSESNNIITVININDFKIQNTILYKKSNINFFGKGFYYNNFLYIPCINNNNETFLDKISLDGQIMDHKEFDGAIFQILKINKKTIIYLGYNKYKDNKIFFEIYDLIKNTIIFKFFFL